MALKMTVEVPLFFAVLGFSLTESVNLNLMIYRTCYLIMGYDKYNCSLLGDANPNDTLEKLVQPRADMIGMVKTSIDSVASALLCLFIGAWSDRFGRKPVIVVSLIGYTVMMSIMVIFSAIETASPWFMILCSVPVILTGGGASLLTVLLAYLTDITSEQVRGFRIGVFDGIMGIAVLLGTSSSSYILKATNYEVVYFLGAVSCLLALLYTIFFIPESLEVRETENRIKGLFQTQNVTGIFQTTCRSRHQYNRAIILLLIFALALYFVIISGDGSVMFLFMRAKFNWSLKSYTWYTSATTIMWSLGATFIVYVIHHKLKIKEAILIFTGFVSMMLGMLIQGLAQADWLIYAASVVKLPGALISTLSRSLISKSVNENEIAKIFSVFTILQNLLGMVGAPVYTLLYNATLNTNPGMFNFVTAGGQAVNALCLMLVLIFQRKTVTEGYTRLEGDSQENAPNTEVASDATTGQEPLLVNC